MNLQRLILTFTREGVEIRALYRTKSGPNPGTKGRAREVTALVRAGLHDALEALQGGPVVNAGGARTLIAWDTIAVLELVND